MSTVMYCWRIKKKDFWETVHRMKQDALHHHGAMTLAAGLRRKLMANQINVSQAQTEYDEEMWNMFNADHDGLLALQVFDEGRTWLFRPLYHGFGFRDQIERLELPIKEVYYDGRSGDRSHYTTYEKASWLDEKIMAGEYLIHIILGKQEPFRAVIHDIWPRGFDKTRDSGP